MFARLFEQVRQNYVEEVSDSELFEMAIQGMLAQLDPHSNFSTKKNVNLSKMRRKAPFMGLAWNSP